MMRDKYTNPELATIAVAILGGATQYIDREDIALKLNELAPGRFNWRKYPENIDLDAVGVALRDAKKEKYGARVTGNNLVGWMLSPEGIKWLETQDVEELQENTEQPRKYSVIADIQTERERLLTTRAFKLFTEDKDIEITLQDFRAFVRINEYFQARARHRRLNIVELAVSDDQQLTSLWALLKERFSEEFT